MRYFWLLTVCLFALDVNAQLPTTSRKKRLTYERTSERRDRGSRADIQEMPGDLVIVAPRSREVVSRRYEQDPMAPVLAEAERAALAVGQELASSFGFREYYKVGFYQSLRGALDQPVLGTWDYLQGERQARSDRTIQVDATQVGQDAATDLARSDAIAEVAKQFHDLTREPDPRGRVGRVEPPPFGSDQFAEPELEDVFQASSLERWGRWSGSSIQFYEGWRPDPWALYRVNSYDQCYDDHWRQSSFALKYYLKDRSASKSYGQLTREEQKAFKAHFEDTYTDSLYQYFDRFQRSAYRSGFQDGWDYGSYLASEWQFQRGYFDGAQLAFQATARDSFLRSYPSDYQRFYDDSFDEWNNNAVVEVLDLKFRDHNNDLIFQPGESFQADYEVANYGGRSGNFVLSLAGDVLDRPVTLSLDLPARKALSSRSPLVAAVSDRTAPGQTYQVRLEVDASTREFPLTVNWPMVLSGPPRVLSRDNLKGYAVLELTFENISTKQISEALVQTEGRKVELGPVDGGRKLSQQFVLEGRDPLDMLSGANVFDASLRVGQTEWARSQFGLPEQATDLENEDLVVFFVSMAQADRVDQNQVRRAQDLMLQRVRADWEAVGRGRGNPYKDDAKQGSGITGLGRLVQAYTKNRPSFLHPQIFEGLSQELLVLSKDLPGTHPFLRKHYKKLVDTLAN